MEVPAAGNAASVVSVHLNTIEQKAKNRNHDRGIRKRLPARKSEPQPARPQGGLGEFTHYQPPFAGIAWLCHVSPGKFTTGCNLPEFQSLAGIVTWKRSHIAGRSQDVKVVFTPYVSLKADWMPLKTRLATQATKTLHQHKTEAPTQGMRKIGKGTIARHTQERHRHRRKAQHTHTGTIARQTQERHRHQHKARHTHTVNIARHTQERHRYQNKAQQTHTANITRHTQERHRYQNKAQQRHALDVDVAAVQDVPEPSGVVLAKARAVRGGLVCSTALG
eukprot:scaffold87729_cov20-Tisochrysis_lutea.AAC.2